MLGGRQDGDSGLHSNFKHSLLFKLNMLRSLNEILNLSGPRDELKVERGGGVNEEIVKSTIDSQGVKKEKYSEFLFMIYYMFTINLDNLFELLNLIKQLIESLVVHMIELIIK